MITRDTEQFFEFARSVSTDFGPACAKAVFTVSPLGFSLAEQSARDNRYMRMDQAVDAQQALAEHGALQQAIRGHCPVICFPGDAGTPDAVFPNNVFATAPGASIIGHMRHPVRQREAQRMDIRRFFTDAMAYREVDLSRQAGICELTGSLIILADPLGYYEFMNLVVHSQIILTDSGGLQEEATWLGIHIETNASEAGAAAMHKAFGLRATLLFNLAETEYHTNVVLSILASRAVVIAPSGFADAGVAAAIADFYQPAVITLSAGQKADYAGNCIALGDNAVFLSERARNSLTPAQRTHFGQLGFELVAVPMPMLEKAGGSLRCCIGEIF